MRGLNSWLGSADSQKILGSTREKTDCESTMDKVRNQSTQLPECKGFCGKHYHLLAREKNSLCSKRVLWAGVPN